MDCDWTAFYSKSNLSHPFTHIVSYYATQWENNNGSCLTPIKAWIHNSFVFLKAKYPLTHFERSVVAG